MRRELPLIAGMLALGAMSGGGVSRHLGTGRTPKTRAEKDAKKRERKLKRKSKKRNRGG